MQRHSRHLRRRQNEHAEHALIKDVALDLGVGDATHMVCPYCNASHETSMRVVRNEAGLYARCYRAACGVRTHIGGLPTIVGRKAFTPRPFARELVEIPTDVLLYLYDMYELTQHEVEQAHFKYDPKHDLLYMPIRDVRGYEIGAQTKALNPNPDYPKAITYWFNDAVKAHFAWPENGEMHRIVVVEDILSAQKVSRILPACAVLTSDMTPDVANLLASNFQSMIVMLDPDATAKALSIKRKYSLYFRNFKVIPLSKDPKDTPFTELMEMLL